MKKVQKSKSYKIYYVLIAILLFLMIVLIIKIASDNNKIKFSEKQTSPYKNLLIKSLSRLEYADDFKDGAKKSVIFISDAEDNKIFVITLNGRILYKIGSGEKGMRNGDFNSASFCAPSGMVFEDDVLYIADTCNNAVRKIDFEERTVSTLVQDDFLLLRPLDVEFFPNKKTLTISCLNNYGLINYSLKQEKLEPSVELFVEDRNIAKLVRYDGDLYFLDLKANAIYKIDDDGQIDEVAKFSAELANLSNFHIDDTGTYIIDTNANKILTINKENGGLDLYSGGGEAGDKLGKIAETSYDTPTDIIAVKDRLYVSDTNNHRIVEINKNTNETSEINIYPDSFSKGMSEMQEYLNNNNFKDKIEFSFNEEGKIILNMSEEFKFVPNAPSSLYIFKQDKENAILIKSYSKEEISSKQMAVPKLDKGETYFIQGTFYYCKKAKLAPCLIKNYNKKIIPNRKDLINEIVIGF